MRPTKFSGPVLYSGQAMNSGSFTDMPIGFNPDYVHKFDDYLTKTIDTTNDYTFTAVSSGTVRVYDRTPADGFPQTSVLSGWALIESDLDTTAVNSGGILYWNEFTQPNRARRPMLAEARVGINNPLNSSFFFGLANNVLNLTTSNRIGFELKSDGSGELQAVAHYVLAGNPDEVRVDTGVIMEPMRFIDGSSTARILSMRIINLNDDSTWAPGPRAHFYIDRRLVATIIQVSPTQPWPISSNVMNSSFYYEKDSEITGIVIDDEILNGTDTGPYNVSGLATNVVNGETVSGGAGGLYGGQTIRVGTEDMTIGFLHTVGVGTAIIEDLIRGANSTTPVGHAADSPIVNATGGCFIDYTSLTQARYSPHNALGRDRMISPEPRG